MSQYLLPIEFVHPASSSQTGWLGVSETGWEPANRGSDIGVRAIARDDASRFRGNWDDLNAAALEANAFLAPGFVLSALQHLNAAEGVRLFVATHDRRTEALGLWPVRAPTGAGFAETWTHAYAPYGTPLISPDCAQDVALTLIDAALSMRPDICGLTIPSLAANGGFAAMLRSCAAEADIQLIEANFRDRPVFACATASGESDFAARNDALTKRTARAGRHLAKRGTVESVSWREPADVAAQFERFLALEAKGWKGRRKTALLMDPQSATFSRVAVRRMASARAIEIDALQVDGEPVAMAVSLFGGRSSFVWKMAYDEEFANCSPGTQLVARLSRRQGLHPWLDRLDSCASPDNPMIYRLWPDRIAICDMFVYRPQQKAEFMRAFERQKLHGRVRSAAKATLKAARRLTG